jgi:hypothetical protein
MNEPQSGQAQLLNFQHLFSTYEYLCKLFRNEFLFDFNQLQSDFQNSLNYFKLLNIVNFASSSGGGVAAFSSSSIELNTKLIQFNYEQMRIFYLLMVNYLHNYYNIYFIILKLDQHDFSDEKQFAKQIQQFAFDNLDTRLGMHDEHIRFDQELLSLNLISNALLTLRNFHLLAKLRHHQSKQYFYKLELNELRAFFNDYKQFLVKLNENFSLLEKKFNKSQLNDAGEIDADADDDSNVVQVNNASNAALYLSAKL